MNQQNQSSRGRQSNSKKESKTSSPKSNSNRKSFSSSDDRRTSSSAPKKYPSRGSDASKSFSKTKRTFSSDSLDGPKRFSSKNREDFGSNARNLNRDDRPKRNFRDKDESFSKGEGTKSRVVKERNTDRKKEIIKRTIPSDNTYSKYKTSKKGAKPVSKNPDKGIRLNKYISNAGICSRREADMYIKAGNVMVNGVTVTEMGYQVKPGDDVKFDNSIINPEPKKYVLLNKPKDYITTLDDERGRKTVMDLVQNACKERIYPVGRLDRNTTGLLLFTNDGELAKKLTHPKHNIHKLYHVTLDKNVIAAHLKDIVSPSFKVEDLPVYVDAVSYVEGSPKSEVGIEIHSGRNRIVRKIFETLGYSVVKLDRVVFAGLTKKDLPKSRWRHLSEQEVINLKNIK